MKCKTCNQEIDDQAKVCPNCGANVVDTGHYPAESFRPQSVHVPEYNQTKSIIFLIWGFFCSCFYLGVVFSILALINGNKVSIYNAAGQYDEARKAYAESEKWNKIALIVNIVSAALIMIGFIIYFVFLFTTITSVIHNTTDSFRDFRTY